MRSRSRRAPAQAVVLALVMTAVAAGAGCSGGSGGNDAAVGTGGAQGAAGTGGTAGGGGGSGGAACTSASSTCFTCAADVFCRLNEQYCQLITGRAGTTASCAAVPGQCLPVPTCACVAATSCQQSAPGALTVTLLAP